VLGSVALIAQGFRAGPERLALVLSGLALLHFAGFSLLELLLPLDRERRLSNDPQRGNDVGHILLGAFGGDALGNLLVAGAVAAVAELVPPIARLWPDDWPVLPQLILLIVVADHLNYWRHRLEHRVPWMWRIHALHHDVDRLHVLKSSRDHLLENVFRWLFVFSPLVLIGAPAAWLPVFSGLLLTLGTPAHANIDLAIPGWLHRVVLTPGVHAIHHARDRRLADSNFASLLPLWDIVFGTYRAPDPRSGRPGKFGIEGEAWPQGFLAQIAAPLRRRTAAESGRRQSRDVR